MTEHLSNPAENPLGDSTDTGLFSRVEGTRNIRGLLLPKDELSRPNASGNAPVMFSAGSIKVPRDVSIITLNTEHDRFNPIGRAVSIEETERGWEAEFAIADTDEGDAYLANPLRKLSAEVAGLVRDAADKSRATFARLTGAAAVKEGAFASAALFSLAEDEAVPDPDANPDAYAAFLERVHADIAAALEAVAAQLSPDTEEPTPTPTPAQESTSDDNKEFSMSESTEAGAQVPVTLAGSTPAKKTEASTDLNAVFSAMHAVKNGVAGQTADAESFLAALADITVNTTGGLTTSASGVIQPAWVGKLWQGARFQRRYIDLGNHQYGGIQLGGRKGFTLDQGTALVQHWNGNKTELPTGKATTGTKSSTLQKYGYAADVAREWFDLEGGAEVIQAFFEGVVDSYAELTDEDALQAILNAARADAPIAPGTYPDGYADAMGMLIDGIEMVQDARDVPTFALVNEAAWRQLMFTPKDQVPEYVSFNFATGGTGSADGKVQVVKADLAGPSSNYLAASAPGVIVGAKNGIEFREQGQTPIQLDALDIARGGVDRAVIGYLETFVVRPKSFVALGTAGA